MLVSLIQSFSSGTNGRKAIDFRSRQNTKEPSFSDVECVLCDMDGTFFQPDHSISQRNYEAINRIKALGIRFFPATGRSRKSMANAGGERLMNLLGGDVEKVPGVFSQGLIVYGHNGLLISEETMEKDAIQLAEEFCDEHNLSVIAYSRDRIITRKRSYFTDQIAKYAEPFPEVMEKCLFEVHEGGSKINKLIILDEEDRLLKIRELLENRMYGRASITRAVPGMLEVLPYQSSKGKGVQKLLEYYNIHPDFCMAFGDGENDIEMIQLVRYGLAMENAKDIVKQTAYGITRANIHDGVAHILDFF